MSMRLFILFLKYQVMKILLNNLSQTLSNLIVRRVTMGYNIYLNFANVVLY